MRAGSRNRLGVSLLLTGLTACGGGAGNAPAEALATGSDPATAATEDAGVDAGRDAGTAPDAAQDAGQSDCTLGDPQFLATVAAVGKPFALDVSSDGAQLLYTVPSCPNATGLPAGTELKRVLIPSGGKLPAPAAAAPGDACALSSDPAVLSAATQHTGYFARRSAGSDELFQIDLSKAAAPVSITRAEGRFSVASAAGLVESTPFLAWATAAPDELPTELAIFPGASASTRKVLVAASAGQRVRSLVVAGLGRGTRPHALGLVAWLDEAAEPAVIHLQVMDDQGAWVGAAQVLSSHAGTFSNVDAVASDAGGALVYTEGSGAGRHEVRMQLLDDGGKLQGDVVKVTGVDEDAHGVAVARYAQGYAVAYRSVPVLATAKATIRVTFTDGLGNVAGTRDVAPAERNFGALRIAQAVDGRLFTAWTDEPEAGPAELHVARVLCP